MTRMAISVALVFLVVAGSGAPAPEHDSASDAAAPDAAGPRAPWRMPLEGAEVVRGFEAPAHDYGPGHRGIDISGRGDTVVASADGVIAFAGPVAGRGVVTLDHGGGLVSSIEPVEDAPAPGTVVAAGDPVGALAAGGHTAPGTIHLGVRLAGRYIDPLPLFGDVPRAILLPCC